MKPVRTIAAAGLFGLAACTSNTMGGVADGSAPSRIASQPDALLAPYYRELAARTDLPVMPQGPALASDAVLTRIAVGSCNQQFRDQDIWPVIAATQPQLALLTGDNVYGDAGYSGEPDMGSFIKAHRLQGSHPEFAAFARAVPIRATWDDHDFGPNDAGGATFPYRAWSERIFETFWRASDEAKARPGVHDSIIVGPEGQRVQIITLDTRFFRSALKEVPYGSPRPPLGQYIADTSPDAEMLGEAQWQWLAAELAKPADLRIVTSSIQVITDAHGFEKWGNMPLERDRLYRLLAGRSGGGVVLLSGDRHQGAVYEHAPEDAGGETFRELTASSLNLSFGREGEAETDREPDPRRLGLMYSPENFGLVDIDWSSREVTLRLLDNAGKDVRRHSYGF